MTALCRAWNRSALSRTQRTILCLWFSSATHARPLQSVSVAPTPTPIVSPLSSVNAFIPTSVVSLCDAASIRLVKLIVSSSAPTDTTFRCGQWIDCRVDDVDAVGGYSVCSTPTQLRRDGVIELAIKLSRHPVAIWFHQRARVGARVDVRFGGDFVYDKADTHRHIVMLAGGVGINPFISIWRKTHSKSNNQSSSIRFYAL